MMDNVESMVNIINCYYERSSNFTGISKQKTNYTSLFFQPRKVHIVNFQHVNQYPIGIMEHVRQIVNEDFHAIVLEQVN